MWRKVVPKGLYFRIILPPDTKVHTTATHVAVDPTSPSHPPTPPFSASPHVVISSNTNEPCCSLSHFTLHFSSMKYVYTLHRSSTSTFSAFRLRETICAQDIKLSAYHSIVEPVIKVNMFSTSGVSVTSSSSHLKV